MARLPDLVDFLDRELNTAVISDYNGAMNGLQLANDGEVPRIIAAVDACMPVIEQAAAEGPGLLLVHHGMFWQGAQAITGPVYRKLKCAMDAGLAIYSSHLPLDVHPQWGNNILLARAIGLTGLQPFFEENGRSMGIRGSWNGSPEELNDALAAALGGPAHWCPGGAGEIRGVGVITGAAGSQVAKVAASGVDAFVTGEGPHWSYTLAEELGIHLWYGGHYATETFGVKALAAALGQQFACPWSFLDHPTGL